MSQRRIDNASKATLLWLEIAATEKENTVYNVSLLTPLGMKINPTTPLLADNQVALSIPIFTCVAAGCVHKITTPRQTIDRHVSVKEIGTQVTAQNGQQIFLPLDKTGFPEAMAKMRSYLAASISRSR